MFVKVEPVSPHSAGPAVRLWTSRSGGSVACVAAAACWREKDFQASSPMADDEKAKLFRRLYTANLHAVLERMRVHGFWPTGVELPKDPANEAKERAQLEQELSSLSQTAGKVDNPEKALQEERVRRWQESKKRRAAHPAAA